MSASTETRFKATGPDGEDMTPMLLEFASAIGLEQAVPGRYSVLLLLELFAGGQSGQMNPAKVVHEIQVLEGLRESSCLKPASVFDRKPLQGLWHKHYLAEGVPSMAINLQKAMKRYGLPWLEDVVSQAQVSGEERFLTEQDISQIAHDAVVGHWERLSEEAALTGEWIIFAQHQGKNHYLCLGRHKSGDEFLRSQIDAVCVREFPFLIDILPKQEGCERGQVQ